MINKIINNLNLGLLSRDMGHDSSNWYPNNVHLYGPKVITLLFFIFFYFQKVKE